MTDKTFNTIFKLIITFSIFLLSIACCETAPSFMDGFKENGYVELRNDDVLRDDYDSLYEAYDVFYSDFKKDELLRQFLIEADKDFKSQDVAKPFANAPVGYRYSENHGKNNKSFYHFTKEYYEFLLKKENPSVESFLSLKRLLEKLSIVDSYSRHNFSNLINKINGEVNGLKDIMYGGTENLTIITKVVRYEKSSGSLSSHPHYDFSGLTLMLDNSDINDENLLLSPYRSEITLDSFKKVSRIYGNSKDYSSCLFIPGLALKLKNLSVPPTPHMVLAIEKPRFALISFAMVPHKHVDYDQIRIKVVDLKKKVSI